MIPELFRCIKKLSHDQSKEEFSVLIDHEHSTEQLFKGYYRNDTPSRESFMILAWFGYYPNIVDSDYPKLAMLYFWFFLWNSMYFSHSIWIVWVSSIAPWRILGTLSVLFTLIAGNHVSNVYSNVQTDLYYSSTKLQIVFYIGELFQNMKREF